VVIEIVKSVNRIPVRLTDERWNHIEARHPEMGSQRMRVLQTVESPDLIQEGDFGEQLVIRHYPNFHTMGVVLGRFWGCGAGNDLYFRGVMCAEGQIGTKSIKIGVDMPGRSVSYSETCT